MHYLENLNPAQRQAAETLDGPVIVIAGAGTGKTRTLIHRLAHLVDHGVPPSAILLLTFTRRAAMEMIHRAGELLDTSPVRITGGTFHSFAAATLRRYGSAIGLARNFTILDQGDAVGIIGNLRADVGDARLRKRLPRSTSLNTIISKMVNCDRALADILQTDYVQFHGLAPQIAAIAAAYADYKRDRQLLDFDDLLVRLIELLEAAPQVRARLQDQYRYVMVDEYQDTNVIQARLTQLLTNAERNIMVVGDDAQSIYAFRGANFRNLFDFAESGSDVRTVKLEQNYRSTQPILEVSNTLMKMMATAFRKRLFSERRGGEPPTLIATDDETEQAKCVVKLIRQAEAAGVPRAEIAVIFRASFHAYPVELQLDREGIRYVKYGGFKFTETAHIKDVLAPLQCVANPLDELAAKRALMLCPGIGRKGANDIWAAADGGLVSALSAYSPSPRQRDGLAALQTLLGTLSAARPAKPVDLLQAARDYYVPLLAAKHDDAEKRQRDLDQLLAMAEDYGSLTAMLSDFAIDPPSTSSSNQELAVETNPDKLVLTTMHSAKGLEWRVVIIIQAVDGAIPMVYEMPDDAAFHERLDEELRLLYVAVTRAKDTLHVVWPRSVKRKSLRGPTRVSQLFDLMPASMLRREHATNTMSPRRWD